MTVADEIRAHAMDLLRIAETLDTPAPPPPPPPLAGVARFGWTWATPKTATNWGAPLTATEVAAARTAARSHASHVLGWGPTEDPATLRDYWAYRTPDVMLLAKAPAWAKHTGDAYDEFGPMPSAWPRLTDLWASQVAELKPKRVIVWSECRGVYPNGFWDLQRNRWAEDHYAALYNMAEPKIRAALPGVQIGGPYVGMSSWNTPAGATKGTLDVRDLAMIEVFMARCNYDFIVVDGGIDLRPNYTLPAGTPEQHVEKLLDVLRWVRARTPKPLLWVETYMHGIRDGVLVREHARAWPYLLDEAAKIPGESVWYAWGSQRDMPDLATLQALAARP